MCLYPPLHAYAHVHIHLRTHIRVHAYGGKSREIWFHVFKEPKKTHIFLRKEKRGRTSVGNWRSTRPPFHTNLFASDTPDTSATSPL